MRHLRFAIYSILALSIAFSSCEESKNKLGAFVILPSPQNFEVTGVSKLGIENIKSVGFDKDLALPPLGPLLKHLSANEGQSTSQITVAIDKDLDVKEEGYQLEISDESINIVAKDQAGLFYAFMTLEQIMEDAQEQEVKLPKCKITDFPELAYRAIQIDVKHHTEKKEYYFDLIDRLAKLKVNAIIAEVEDKIKYKRQPLIGSADAFTIEEWVELSNYAKDRNIEISPLVQGLGHASFILKHDKYKPLRDDPESDWAFNPLDPETYKVQFDLYLDAFEATPHGKYLHVGGDEVHTTGRGSGRSALELQLIWLDKVCKFAAEHNRIPIFWDDMPLKHAEVYRPMFDRKISPSEVDEIWAKNEYKLLQFIDQFPKNCIYMRWNYQKPETYGNLKAMEWFTDNGFQVMGATAGQTRWSLMPQEESNLKNIQSFALSSIDKGLNGLLLTLWDDDSPHFELYMRGITGFAEFSWAGDKRTISELKTAFRHRTFGHELASEEYAFIDQLESPVGFWKNALLQSKKSRNNLRRENDPINDAIIGLPSSQAKGDWSESNIERLKQARKYLAVSDSIAEKIKIAQSKSNRNAHTLDVYEQVNNLVNFSMNTLVTLEDYDRLSPDLDQKIALRKVLKLQEDFVSLRSELEEVYGRTRVLNKPANYILDQDHHTHNANQSLNFDWQVYPEMLLMEKLSSFR